MTDASPSERPARPAPDPDATVEHQIQQLRRRRDQLDGELDEHRRRLSSTLEAVRTLQGRGSAEDDAVVVVVDARNHLVDLQLDPRALRLGSIEHLRRALLTAHHAACTDVARRLAEAGATDSDPEQDPVAALMAKMPEVTAMVGVELFAPPEEPDEPPTDDHPPRPNPFV